jgi:hypothetical protein
MIHVAVENHSTALSDTQVDLICVALTGQGSNHIARAWGLTGVNVSRIAPRSTSDWLLVFLDNSDQAGALGYHDDQVNGHPLMKVFVKSCEEAGISPSACASHELGEAMVDPDLIRATVDGGKAWFCEIGDPAQAITYVLDGIEVQDFVTPAWFNPSPPAGAKFSRTGQIKHPFEVPAGGYAQYTTDLQTWHQVGAELGAGHTRPARRRGAVPIEPGIELSSG